MTRMSRIGNFRAFVSFDQFVISAPRSRPAEEEGQTKESRRANCFAGCGLFSAFSAFSLPMDANGCGKPGKKILV
jgi:hypothetical protein